MNTFVTFQTLREATFDRRQRTARVVIITEGLGNLRDKNYYTKEAVLSAAKVFNGKPFFLDHPTEEEEDARPERSVRDQAGYFFGPNREALEIGTVRDPDTGAPLTACFANLRFDNSSAGKDAFEKVVTAIEYQQRFPASKDVYAGISVNGRGVSEAGSIDGMQVHKVVEIKDALSADIVTKPARGGKFLSIIQEAARTRAWLRGRRAAGRSGMKTKSGTKDAEPRRARATQEAERPKPPVPNRRLSPPSL